VKLAVPSAPALAPVVLLGVLLGMAVAGASAQEVRADIYSWKDAEGTIHFTNIKPKANAAKWKKVATTDPAAGSKATAQRGKCEGCDKVAAADNSPERYHRFDEFIYEAAELYRIPVPLIRAVIKTESDYDPHVVSSMDAKGLMQLMPAVVEDMGVSDVWDPRQNILGGTRLLRWLANRYDGDLTLTIAGYHAGPGSLAKYGNKVPPYQRTQQYLKMVLTRYYEYKSKDKAPR
jgi:soluble lytic murein transglycosylase-like protein